MVLRGSAFGIVWRAVTGILAARIMRRHPLCLTILTLGLVWGGPLAAQDYHQLTALSFGDASAWTAMVVDAESGRLYAAHGGRIEVVDLASGAPVGAITNVPDVRGLALGPKFHLGYATCGKAGVAHLFNLKTLRLTDKMRTGADPAAIVYEPGSQELYAFNMGGRSVTIGEADDGDRLTTLDLGGRPTAAVVDGTDAKHTRLLTSLEDGNEVVVIDAVKHKVAAHWPVSPARAPHALAMDAANHRLYVACEGQLLALDLNTGATAATLALPTGAASLASDPARQMLFCAGTDGSVAVVHVDSPDHLSVAQTLPALTGAAVLAVDPRTHQLLIGATPEGGRGKIVIFGL